MKFLETLTAMNNDALVPINKIQYINFGYYGSEKGWRIKIKTIYKNIEYEESFGENDEKALERYKMIKEIIGAK